MKAQRLINKEPRPAGKQGQGSIPNYYEGNFMNAITTTLSFQDVTFAPVTREKQKWLRLSEVAQAIGYADAGSSLARIYARHADEFTASMTRVFKLATAGGKQAVRVFSLRGAHLLAMFARTDKAKSFRVWVLDILDREIETDRLAQAAFVRLNGVQREELESMCIEIDYLNCWWKKFGPGIEKLSPELYHMVREQFLFAGSRARSLSKELGLKTHHQYFETFPWWGSPSQRAQHREACRGLK